MTEEGNLILEMMKDQMEHAIIHLEKELHKFRTGKASPQMLEGVKVDYYGTLTALDQVANINTPDARSIVVQPWEKSMLGVISKAIIDANLGLNPQNNGELLRMQVPPLTEERRKELVKKAKEEAENAKVSVRNARRASVEEAKKLTKQGISEDDVKSLEKEIQTVTDSYIVKIDKVVDVKEKDIMTV